MSKQGLILAGFVVITAILVLLMIYVPVVWSFMNNSNFGGAIIGIWLPGGFIYFWTHYLHRQHRAEMRDLHTVLLAKLDHHGDRLARIHLNQIRAARKDGPV